MSRLLFLLLAACASQHDAMVGTEDVRPILAAALASSDVPSSAVPALAALANAEGVPGDANLVSWLRPGRWRFQRCQTVNAAAPLIWVPKGTEVKAGTPVKVILAEGYRDVRAPRRAMWMVLSTTTLPEPIDLTGTGMPGCWLELPLDNVVLMMPGTAKVGHCTRINGIVDRVEFEWTPGADHVGQRVFCQGVVAAPGENAAGLLVTDAVELVVGSGS